MAKKILIIDDEEDLLFLISFRLKSNGFEVITALNGPDGLEKAKDETPDLIILDIMMPGMDGYETARILKEGENTKYIPVIFLTGTIEPIKVEKSGRVKEKNYILKPFEPEELLHMVKRELGILE